MEEQLLPWWKRALRAAIGTLRSGFGFFGKPQQEDVAAASIVKIETAQIVSSHVPKIEPVFEIETAEIPALKEEKIQAELPEEHVDEVEEAESIERSEPEVVIEPDLEEVIVEVTNGGSEERTIANPSASPSTRVTRSGLAQDENSQEEGVAIEAVEEELAEISSEPVIEDAVIAEAEPEVEVVETGTESEDELVELQEVDEEQAPEINSVERTEQTEEELEVGKPAAEAKIETGQESVHEVTIEKVYEEKEQAAEHYDLAEVEPEEVAAESIPSSADEIEEMKPLHEEIFPEPESANTESPDEAEQERLPVVTTVEIQATAEAEAEPVISAPAMQHPIKHAIKEDDDKSSPFSIIVSQVYEGPMDLLLDLIRKQDIDIYDIPIAKITEQFLAYVERLRASDMDMAGEFIYTASLLIHIKSKTLLPRAPSGQDDQFEDPRRELVERLLEHERFKNAAQMLQQKQMIEDATWTNPGLREFKGDAGTEPELAADTVDLVRVFQEILDRARNRPVINVEEDSVTVGQMIQFLGRRLNMEDKPIALRKLLAHTHSQRALVAMFLALLELVRLQAVLLRQDRLFSEIFIKKHEGFDTVMTEGFLQARDDWN